MSDDVTKQSLEKLQDHAGLTSGGLETNQLSAIVYEWRHSKFGNLRREDLRAAATDVIRCLDRINAALFADRIKTPPDHRLTPDNLTYAIAEILRAMSSAIRASANEKVAVFGQKAVLSAMETIAGGWSAFMAGDIRQIEKEIELLSLWSDEETEGDAGE